MFFKSKSGKEHDKLRLILNRLTVGEIISEKHWFYKELTELIKKHPYQDAFKGELDYFLVQECNINRFNKNIAYVAKDGYKNTFSIYKCLAKKRESNLKFFKRAMRGYIKPQILDFRYKEFKKSKNGYLTCEISKLKFKIDSCHVDHKYPRTFDSLIHTFIKYYNIDVDKQIYIFPDNDYVEIEDQNVINSFLDFHEKYGKLRCVYFRANLQQKRNSKCFVIRNLKKKNS